MRITKALGVVLLFLLFNPCARAQSEKVRQTYTGPDLSTLWELLKNPSANDVRVDVLKFTPVGDSGVTKALADAFGGTPEERATLVQAFAQLKQAYEAEVAREGKSNNLAAAMTFFIAANVMSYYQTEMPSDADIAKLMESMQRAMAQIPAFAQMTGPEKHRLHDWLACMGGFAFEGIGETNLVLQPPAATSRDGVLASNSLFPNAYLYTRGDKLEWRF